jgi:perosamine synthetase
MTNMQAALGLAQLERLEEFIKRKRKMGALYTELLSDLTGVQIPLEKTDFASNIYWVFGLVIDESLGLNAKMVMEALREKGIGTRPFFYPMNQQPVLRKMGLFADEHFPVSERLYKQGFYIPSGMAITEEQIIRSAKSVKEVLQ